jgi:predicted transcriptional regulator
MEMLKQVFKVEDSEKKENLLEILSDRYSRTIIESIMNKPKSVVEITAETGIPVSTVYRRIQTLSDNKLLYISGSISEDGKKFFLYKSKVKGIQTQYENGDVNVELVLNLRN